MYQRIQRGPLVTVRRIPCPHRWCTFGCDFEIPPKTPAERQLLVAVDHMVKHHRKTTVSAFNTVWARVLQEGRIVCAKCGQVTILNGRHISFVMYHKSYCKGY